VEWQGNNVELAQCAVNRKLLVYYNGFLAVNGATASEFRVSAEAIIVSASLKMKLLE
jgi:hypothetical protein